MTIIAVLAAVALIAVLARLVLVVLRDDVRHIPTSHWVDPASAHDRWERVNG